MGQYLDLVLATPNLELLYIGDDVSGTTMNDASGKGRHGTIYGAPDFSQPPLVVAETNNATRYERTTSDYVASPAISTGTLNSTGITFETWVYPHSFQSVSPYISAIMGTEEGWDAKDRNNLRWGDESIAPGQIQWVIALNGGENKLTSPATYTTGQLYHIVGTYDGSMQRLYVNGVEVASKSSSGSLTSTLPIQLSRQAGGRYADQTMAWNAYYSRGLTAQEVLDHYNTGITSGDVPDTFDETGVPHTFDAVLSGIDNTIVHDLSPTTLYVYQTGVSTIEVTDVQATSVRFMLTGTDVYTEYVEPLQYQITFTPNDNTSTQVTYEVWTGAGATGTMLLDGTAATGVEHTTATISDAYLVHGTNTRYLRVTDVQGNTAEYGFIIDAVIGDTYEEALGEQIILNMTDGMDNVLFIDTLEILGVSAVVLGEITAFIQEVGNVQNIDIYQHSEFDFQIMEIGTAEDVRVAVEGIFGSIWTEDDVESYTAIISGQHWVELEETGEVFDLYVLTDSDSSKTHIELDPYTIQIVVTGIEFDPGDADSAFIMIVAQERADESFIGQEFGDSEIGFVSDAIDFMSWTEVTPAQLWATILGVEQSEMLEIDDTEIITVNETGTETEEWNDLAQVVSEYLWTGSTDVFDAMELAPTVIDFSVGGFDSPAVSEVGSEVEIYVYVGGKDRIPLRVYMRIENTMFHHETLYTSDLMTIDPYTSSMYHDVTYTADIEVIQ